jgi:hypothetical protein
VEIFGPASTRGKLLESKTSPYSASVLNIVTRRVVRVTKITDSGSDDLIY